MGYGFEGLRNLTSCKFMRSGDWIRIFVILYGHWTFRLFQGAILLRPFSYMSCCAFSANLRSPPVCRAPSVSARNKSDKMRYMWIIRTNILLPSWKPDIPEMKTRSSTKSNNSQLNVWGYMGFTGREKCANCSKKKTRVSFTLYDLLTLLCFSVSSRTLQSDALPASRQRCHVGKS